MRERGCSSSDDPALESSRAHDLQHKRGIAQRKKQRPAGCPRAMRRFCFSLVAADRGCGGGGAMRSGKGTYPKGESQLADSTTPPQHFTAVGAKRASRQRGRVEAAAAMRTWHTTSRRKRCAFKRTRPCLLRSPRLIVGGGRTTVQAAGEEAARVGRREATRRTTSDEWGEKAAR
jgi:hypothetical protein